LVVAKGGGDDGAGGAAGGVCADAALAMAKAANAAAMHEKSARMDVFPLSQEPRMIVGGLGALKSHWLEGRNAARAAARE